MDPVVGIVGGGQLARMMHQASISLGIHVRLLSDAAGSSAAQVVHDVVHVGQRVREGQIIGYVGTTGFSTGCHLHLMVWIGGRLRNPMTWF